MKVAVFWVLAPCSLVEVHRRFKGACCLHHQGDRRDHRAATQKTVVFTLHIIVMYRINILLGTE
jgi:hypothetical protein